MALSTQTVVSDGSLVLLDISIVYLDRSEISVYFDSVLQPTGWAWVGLTEKQITFSPAVPIGTVVLVKRTTVLADLRHKFSLGAAFTAQYLDEALRQVLHITQEAKEANFSADFYTALNLHLNQIKFLADPTDAQDAVTKVWAETAMSSQLAQATTQASNALASAAAADVSEAAALAAKVAAELAEVHAETAETNAAASAAAANASKIAAALSETNAAASAAAAAASYDSFDDRWLGPKAADPALDNDGAALLVGAAYFNTTTNELRVYTGTIWQVAVALAAGTLYAANNLSDVADVATARTNLDAQQYSALLTAIAAGPSGSLGNRNRIINGDFRVRARPYVSGNATLANQYVIDRWKVSTTAGITYATVDGKTTVTIPAGQTLVQVIEGLNLQSGTYTLSWEGTAQGKIGAGAYGASGITGAITGGTDTTIDFGPGTVTNVQLELGSMATPYEQRTLALETLLCQRYYEVATAEKHWWLASAGGQVHGKTIRFLVQKRIAPTVTPGAFSNVNASGSTLEATFAHGFNLYAVSAAAGVGVTLFNWSADAEL